MDIEDEKVELLDRVSLILVDRAAAMGVTGFRVKDDVLDLEDAMDQDGPMPWALFMHSSIISRMSGLPNCPFECVVDPDSVFGCKGIINPSNFSVSMATYVLDAALEHAVVVGLKDLDCSREEWSSLPAELRVLSVEVYLQELGQNWVGSHLEFGSAADKVLGWPVLLDFQSNDESMGANQSVKHGESIKVSGLSPFTPKQ